MKNRVEQLQHRLWRPPEGPRLVRGLVTLGRYAFVLVRDLVEGQLTMRAMSLVYTTLLSLAPMLALGFSLFKALGVHNLLEPVLRRFLEPLGPKSEELTRNLIGFVENIQVGVLGSLGVALLFYTAISMIRKVESSFNFIWRIERVRPLSQRLGEYLAVLIVGPVLVFSSLGLTASVLNSQALGWMARFEPFGATLFLIGELLPYALIIAAFTFVYSFMPSTKVRFRAALAGGTLAGFGWQSASVGFASFAAGATNYNAIYSGFAIVVLLLIWLYIGWLVLLTGCQLAYYVQHPEQVRRVRSVPFLSPRRAEDLGLCLLREVGRRYLAGAAPLTEDALTRLLAADADHVHRLVEVLCHHRLLAVTEDRGALLPGRDFDSISLGETWRLLRNGFDTAHDGSAVLDAIEQEFLSGAGAQSLRRWLAGP